MKKDIVVPIGTTSAILAKPTKNFPLEIRTKRSSFAVFQKDALNVPLNTKHKDSSYEKASQRFYLKFRAELGCFKVLQTKTLKKLH